jgi:hypothetical protein
MVALIRRGALVGRPSLYKIAQAVRGSAARAAHAMRRVPGHHFALGLAWGKLKRPEKISPLVDLKAVRAERVLKRIKTWEAKRRRADRALRKLQRQRA